MISADSSEAVVLALHARKAKLRLAALLAMGAIMVAASLADVVTGSSGLTVSVLVKALIAPASVDMTTQVIVWDIRLANAALALLVGAALALAGAEMQTALDNPLASPFTLGVSSAAAFGAALAIVAGIALPGLPEAWQVPLNAFLAAVGAMAVIYGFARLSGLGSETLVLFGVATMFAANAALALMQYVASPQALQEIIFWSLGSLGRAGWTEIGVLAAVLAVVVPCSLASAQGLNALRFGDDRARSFGVDVDRLRFLALLRVSVLTATAVAFVGTIAFVGLVAPHMARLMVGEDHRVFLPASVLSGAIVMAFASIASKLIAPGLVAPVGVVTSIVGVPIFMALIFARRRRS
jgi:iron complex transport system permease protein